MHRAVPCKVGVGTILDFVRVCPRTAGLISSACVRVPRARVGVCRACTDANEMELTANHKLLNGNTTSLPSITSIYFDYFDYLYARLVLSVSC